MRKPLLTVFAALVAISLSIGPGTARAGSGHEDSLEDCEYPKMFDLIVMRPLSFASFAVGTGLWAGLVPWTILVARSDLDEVTYRLMGKPAAFTFTRPLGECVGTLRY